MQTSARREAEFIGKITASATHEMRNVLAIVKESAGLMEDLVRASNGARAPDPDRLLRAAARIDAQVARGAEIMTRLNRFAHSMDHGTSRVDLNDEVVQVVFLSQRMARQRHQRVEAGCADRPIVFTGNSLRVQMALHGALECCLEHLPEGAVVRLVAAEEGGRPAACLTAETGFPEGAPGPEEAPGWERLTALLPDLGFAVEVSGGGYGIRLLYEGGD